MLPSWLDRSQRAALLITAFLTSAGYSVMGLVLLLLTLTAEGIIKRRVPWRHSAADVFIIAFVAVFMISGWVSQYRPVAVGSAGLAALTIYLAFGPLYQLLRRDKAFLKTFLGTWVAGGMLSAAWAFYLHRVTGRAAYTPELTQNVLATTVLLGLVLALGVFLTSKSQWRYLVGAGCVILALALAETTSRGAWLGAAVALVSFFLLVEFRYAREGLVIIFLAGLIVISATAPERASLVERAESILQVSTDRGLLARSAVAIFADHPLVGTGLNTFSLVHAKYKPPGDTNVAPPFAHNVFLNMAAEGGAFGFVAFSSIVLWTVVAGLQWRKASTSTSDQIMSATILSGFLGIVVHQMFDGTVLTVHLGSALWFLIAIVATFQPDLRQAAKT